MNFHPFVAVVGWIMVDQGLRFPGSQYGAIAESVGAHDPMVSSGNMTIMLLGAFFLEMIGGAAVFGAASGSGRAPGEYKKIPLSSISLLLCGRLMDALDGGVVRATHTVPYTFSELNSCFYCLWPSSTCPDHVSLGVTIKCYVQVLL